MLAPASLDHAPILYVAADVSDVALVRNVLDLVATGLVFESCDTLEGALNARTPTTQSWLTTVSKMVTARPSYGTSVNAHWPIQHWCYWAHGSVCTRVRCFGRVLMRAFLNNVRRWRVFPLPSARHSCVAPMVSLDSRRSESDGLACCLR